jgi:hypothetical protein
MHSKRKRAIDVSNILLFNLNPLEKLMGHVVLRIRRYEAASFFQGAINRYSHLSSAEGCLYII